MHSYICQTCVLLQQKQYTNKNKAAAAATTTIVAMAQHQYEKIYDVVFVMRADSFMYCTDTHYTYIYKYVCMSTFDIPAYQNVDY